MAKSANFIHGDSTWQAGITKVDRDKVYGWVEELVLDAAGRQCHTAGMLDDGMTLVMAGAAAFKTVTGDGIEVQKKDLVTVNADGSPAIPVPSVFDSDVVLNDATIDALYDIEVKSIYQLQFEDEKQKKELAAALSNGSLFSFTFNYRTDYEGDDAIMLSALGEVFILTGRRIEFEYLTNASIPVLEDEGDNEEDESLDFGLL